MPTSRDSPSHCHWLSARRDPGSPAILIHSHPQPTCFPDVLILPTFLVLNPSKASWSGRKVKRYLEAGCPWCVVLQQWPAAAAWTSHSQSVFSTGCWEEIYSHRNAVWATKITGYLEVLVQTPKRYTDHSCEQPSSATSSPPRHVGGSFGSRKVNHTPLTLSLPSPCCEGRHPSARSSKSHGPP